MLEARDISLSFGPKRILSNVSFRVDIGQVCCLSGPSGCGKTSLGRILAGLQKPTGGQIAIEGHNIGRLRRWPVQYLYQSPLSAMNPRWRIRKILSEPGPVDEVLAQTLGVSAQWADYYPHELSGGQLQRVAILRALGANPRYLIADEITSALDPVAQVQIWHLLLSLTRNHHVGIVAITHDAGLLAQLRPYGNNLRLG